MATRQVEINQPRITTGTGVPGTGIRRARAGGLGEVTSLAATGINQIRQDQVRVLEAANRESIQRAREAQRSFDTTLKLTITDTLRRISAETPNNPQQMQAGFNAFAKGLLSKVPKDRHDEYQARIRIEGNVLLAKANSDVMGIRLAEAQSQDAALESQQFAVVESYAEGIYSDNPDVQMASQAGLLQVWEDSARRLSRHIIVNGKSKPVFSQQQINEAQQELRSRAIVGGIFSFVANSKNPASAYLQVVGGGLRVDASTGLILLGPQGEELFIDDTVFGVERSEDEQGPQRGIALPEQAKSRPSVDAMLLLSPEEQKDVIRRLELLLKETNKRDILVEAEAEEARTRQQGLLAADDFTQIVSPDPTKPLITSKILRDQLEHDLITPEKFDTMFKLLMEPEVVENDPSTYNRINQQLLNGEDITDLLDENYAAKLLSKDSLKVFHGLNRTRKNEQRTAYKRSLDDMEDDGHKALNTMLGGSALFAPFSHDTNIRRGLASQEYWAQAQIIRDALLPTDKDQQILFRDAITRMTIKLAGKFKDPNDTTDRTIERSTEVDAMTHAGTAAIDALNQSFRMGRITKEKLVRAAERIKRLMNQNERALRPLTPPPKGGP